MLCLTRCTTPPQTERKPGFPCHWIRRAGSQKPSGDFFASKQGLSPILGHRDDWSWHSPTRNMQVEGLCVTTDALSLNMPESFSLTSNGLQRFCILSSGLGNRPGHHCHPCPRRGSRCPPACSRTPTSIELLVVGELGAQISLIEGLDKIHAYTNRHLAYSDSSCTTQRVTDPCP